jgi:hypothetical protein
LVQEEMRRVLEYMSWFANWWTSHAAVPSIAHDPYLSEGLMAYAIKQANLRLSLRNHFQTLWKDVPSWLSTNEVSGQEPMSDDDDD